VNSVARAETTGDLARVVGASDVLVFARGEDTWRLLGGLGRGGSWAGVVEVRLDDEPVLKRAWGSGLPVRSRGELARIAGPYWSTHAAVVPVGDDYLVVMGGAADREVSDAILVHAAAQAVAVTTDVGPAKLLADELELVHAVRQLMEYRPETGRDTARHIAASAARSLSCEIAVTELRREGEWLRVRVDRDADPGATWEDFAPGQAPSPMSRLLVEQEAYRQPGAESDEIIARLSLPLGSQGELGVLTLAHTSRQPRGFTMLCQRIGRALAEASSLVIEQALVREALNTERAELMRLAKTDGLTGIGNRLAWDEAIASESARIARVPRPAAVLSADLDELKEINDRYGHAAGDVLIRGAASMLAGVARDSDLVCRVGGDEFLVLLTDTGRLGARCFTARLRRAMSAWRVTEHALTLRLSLGSAVVPDDGDLVTAVAAADRRMYANKRRRRSRQRSTVHRPRSESARRAAGPSRGAAPSERRAETLTRGRRAVLCR